MFRVNPKVRLSHFLSDFASNFYGKNGPKVARLSTGFKTQKGRRFFNGHRINFHAVLRVFVPGSNGPNRAAGSFKEFSSPVGFSRAGTLVSMGCVAV